MGNYTSPGVYNKEIDISQVVPTISTTTAAICFASNQGDVTKIQMMSNTQQFIAEYGTPVLGNPGHYSALAFLNNGSQLWCYRVQNQAKYGGVNIAYTGGTSAAIPTGQVATTTAYPSLTLTSGLDTLFQIYAKDPGTWNNNIAVAITNVANGPTTPTSPYEFDIVVYELVNGVYQTVETWSNVSRQFQLDGQGRQEYLMTKINGNSNYIYVVDNTNISPSTLPLATNLVNGVPTPLAMAQGSNGSPVTDAQFGTLGSGTGWDLFSNPSSVDVRILIGAGAGGPLGAAGSTTIATQLTMKSIAESRKDCMAILDVPQAQTTNSTVVTNWRTVTQNFNSSYTALYAPWLQIYDSYNASLVWLPPSGFVASQFAFSDNAANTWAAPAGLNRGVLPVLSVSPVWAQGDRDLLYTNGINPIQTFPGEGNVIWGQKTQQFVDSALNRINVRRLLIVIEKSISIGLQSYVFEPDNQDTWFRIQAMMEMYLDTLSAGGAFELTATDSKGYLVQIDNQNNPPQAIDSETLYINLFLHPIRVAEVIVLSCIVTPTGVSFTQSIAAGTGQ